MENDRSSNGAIRGAGSGPATGWAEFDGVRASGVLECIDLDTHAHRLDEGGVWFVVADFTGPARAWRFAQVDWTPEGFEVPWGAPTDYRAATWRGPHSGTWTSSCTEAEYRGGVETIRRLIRDGGLLQANLCRVLSAPLSADSAGEPDAFGLARILARGNPAPYAGLIHVPAASGVDPVWIVTASPELYLEREGDLLTSGPIKGTAPTAEELLPKDRAENIMITDLVRNDLHKVCEPDSVTVERLLALEEHPGLAHLVSTVSGRLLADDVVAWPEILPATFPPGSVAGAPKVAALDTIARLEPEGRGPYCGAIGWVDADRNRARLAVGIRTFWWARGTLRFGTGAGITWGSDAATEWQETELKAKRLVELASQTERDTE